MLKSIVWELKALLLKSHFLRNENFFLYFVFSMIFFQVHLHVHTNSSYLSKRLIGNSIKNCQTYFCSSFIFYKINLK